MSDSAIKTKGLKPPFADFGIIGRMFIALTSSLLAFSLTTCVTILTMLAYSTITAKTVDYTVAYRVSGLIAGSVMFVVAITWVVWAGIWRLQHPVRSAE